MINTPVSDPEPPASDTTAHALWAARRADADTTIDHASKEGLLARLAHAWRRHRSAPLVAQPLLAAELDRVVVEYEQSGGDPEQDAKVAAAAVVAKAEADAVEALDPLPTEPFGHPVDPAAPVVPAEPVGVEPPVVVPPVPVPPPPAPEPAVGSVPILTPVAPAPEPVLILTPPAAPADPATPPPAVETPPAS